jgi:FlaA1/EpsC-like NDP-sugar epimerase
MSKELISDKKLADFYKGKKILVIGGTGTVGAGIVDMLLGFNPDVVRILSRDEYKQFLLSNKYGENKNLRFLLGDVRDYERVERAAQGIDVIFNLAALKHVPACEYNPFEAVKTNVIGTQNVINAALSCAVDHVALTSSDKAISPTNAMGATKLLGERLIIAADRMKGSRKTAFSAVRFGNVIGSRGSVVPLFVEQVKNGEKVTVTEPLMTRFMMSIKEAVSLTIRSAAVAKGGEIFVLKMPNIKILDLAETVSELVCEKYGLERAAVTMEIVGLRIGEKMYEELMTKVEAECAYELSDMYVIVPHDYCHEQIYKSVPRAKAQSYSSETVEIISKEELKAMLAEEIVDYEE